MTEHHDDPYYEYFRVGFKEWSPKVIGFLRGAGANEQEAEDALQAAVVSILTSRPTMDNVKQYLMVTARNEYFSALRKLERERRHSDLLQEDETLIVASSCPEQQALAQESQSRIGAALRTLPSAHREAFVLRAGEGFSYAEIAQIAGRKENTVCQHYKRAASALEEMLRE